ncbi:phosphotransferase enzyme family protein [Chondromyces crocatus]|uniref:Aminoglycoside phosphotransferase domain-containing protein n=1 Tax=Chondromyces crocatus TaxID=52 RepID=A0A0K1E7C2_CHOCO|nr:phosphotransferase [Chondromyces crocatus]AKT36759.1 uncharacterized protein CMC5_008800 [Chondromyces crocatus]
MIPDAWSALRGLSARPADDAGLINTTLTVGEPPRYIAQRVHPLFAPSVHDDIEAVTVHLASRGRVTPRLVRTDEGGLWARDPEGGVWRVMDFIPGRTLHRIPSPAVARDAGALVARFHEAVDDLVHDYRHVRPGAHDTGLHMQRLEGTLTQNVVTEEGREREGVDTGGRQNTVQGEGRAVAEAILDAWRTWQGRLDLPERHCHGDLKISNIRFSASGEALCLVDLDTLARYPLDVELGDAWRSWCNPVGEDSLEPRFDLEIFEAAVAGYLSVRPFRPEEREALAGAAERIALELSARFCRDVFEDSYFGWDSRRFASRREHNLYRARGQLALACSARQQRQRIAEVLAR